VTDVRHDGGFPSVGRAYTAPARQPEGAGREYFDAESGRWAGEQRGGYADNGAWSSAQSSGHTASGRHAANGGHRAGGGSGGRHATNGHGDPPPAAVRPTPPARHESPESRPGHGPTEYGNGDPYGGRHQHSDGHQYGNAFPNSNAYPNGNGHQYGNSHPNSNGYPAGGGDQAGSAYPAGNGYPNSNGHQYGNGHPSGDGYPAQPNGVPAALHGALLARPENPPAANPGAAPAWSGAAWSGVPDGAGEFDLGRDPGLLTHQASFDPDGDPLDFPAAPSFGGTGYDSEYPQFDPEAPGGDEYPPPPGPDRGRHRHLQQRPRWVRVLGWTGATLGVLVGAVAGWGVYEYKKINSNITRIDALAPDDKNIKEAAKQLDAENFLLIGSDTRAGENGKYGNVGGERSDTTILAHLSPNREKALLVSFPRDSWVDIPSCRLKDGTMSAPTTNLFNSAFSTGGAQCTVLTVQKMTGIRINHYVQVDFTGFKSMVNALGGVNVCSTEEVWDRESGLRLRKGNQIVTGEQALAYVRARKHIGDWSDLGRIQRQQKFLGAMIRKATSSKLLVNPIALTRFLEAGSKALTLDKATSLGDLKKLADQLRHLDAKHVTFLTSPIANQDYAPPGTGLKGKVLLDDLAGQRLWNSIINDKPAPPKTTPGAGSKPNARPPLTVAPSEVAVRVLNGVGQAGLAAKVQSDLATAGFATVGVGNENPPNPTSIVRYAPARREAARTLAAAVPGAALQEDPSLGQTLVLVVGTNYTAARPVKVGDPGPVVKTARPTTPAPTSSTTSSTSTQPPISAADTSCT
jgi:LCP family protein required for cell wall assembly